MADSRNPLERAIAGALRATIRDHGYITPEDVGSATKRVVGQLRNVRPPEPAPTGPEALRLAPVLRAAYACICARCGASWLSPCDCPTIAAPEDLGVVVIPLPAHQPGCSPPKRCTKCKAKNWHLPRRPRGRPRNPSTSGKGGA